jgi:hypothetical protein
LTAVGVYGKGHGGWGILTNTPLAHPRGRENCLEAGFPQPREHTRFYALLPLPVLHRTLLEFGRRLADAGMLDVPEDVFHFRLDDLDGVGRTWPPPAQLTDELRALMVQWMAARVRSSA